MAAASAPSDRLPSEASIDQALAQRDRVELAGSLRMFVAEAWPWVEPGTVFVPNWHIDAILEHLEAAYRREIRRLLINIPPRHMKSFAVGVLGPAWRWTHRPQEKFLTMAYGYDLATRDAVRTRDLIRTPWYQARWGDVFALKADQNEKGRYDNDRRGYRIATSRDGATTGEGGDVLLIDDPHKALEAHSDTEREKTIRWWGGTWATRMNDPATAIKIVIMQRLHEDDLSGHILAGDNDSWTHLCLPAEYEPSHPFLWPDDPRTEPGELLWPDHIDADGLAEIVSEMPPYERAGQMQQRPAPAEGGILKRHWWRTYRPAEQPDGSEDWAHLPRFTRLIQSWDTALKEKTSNDFTVGTLWGLAGANRFLLRRARGRWNLAETKTQLRLLTQWAQERWPQVGMAIVVENAANGPEVIAQMRDEISGIVPYSPTVDKVQRAHAITPQLEAGNVLVPGFRMADGELDPARTPSWVLELVDECASFPNGSYDDQVDSVTMALIRAGVPVLTSVPSSDAVHQPETRRALSAGLREQVF